MDITDKNEIYSTRWDVVYLVSRLNSVIIYLFIDDIKAKASQTLSDAALLSLKSRRYPSKKHSVLSRTRENIASPKDYSQAAIYNGRAK